MKSVVWIVIFLMVGFTARPLLHEMIHSHKHDMELAQSCCNTSDTNEGSENSRSCCHDHHPCDGSCHCAFSASIPFVSIVERPIVAYRSSIDILPKYNSIYSFTPPSLIWHPPQLL